jgi:hypothetical protein
MSKEHDERTFSNSIVELVMNGPGPIFVGFTHLVKRSFMVHPTKGLLRTKREEQIVTAYLHTLAEIQ